MITRKEVAKLAGVSPATVSNVFDKPSVVKPDTREKVMQAAKQLKYAPNHAAKILSSGNSRHIGIAVFEYTNPYHMEIIRGIENYAIGRDYMVTVFLLDNAIHDKFSFIQSKQLSALVNFTTNTYPESFIDILMNSNTVLVDFGADKGLSTMIDMRSAYCNFMEKLREFGHRIVGFVTGMDCDRFYSDVRGQLFLDREKYGLCKDENLIAYNDDYTLSSEERGYLGAKKLLAVRKDITALFAINDMAAIGAIRAVSECGYSVPEDISVIGCDDISLARYVNPSLTTISCNKYDFGRQIAEKILECVEGHKDGTGEIISIPAECVYRESLIPVGKKRKK